MVSEKEKFAAMLAQREDTGYNWTKHWRVNAKGVCMTAKMREDRATTNRPLNTMDELAYKELETENKNLKNSLGEANDRITVLQLQSKPSQEEKKDWKVTLSYNIRHDDTYLIQNETKEGAIYIAENQNTSPKHDCICIKEN